MSTDDLLDVVAPEAVPGVRILGVAHDRLDFAPLTRLALDRADPDVVAVELPDTIADGVDRAIGRLPRLSLVVAEADSEEPVVWITAPGDPFVEGLRWAREHGARRELIDPDVRYPDRRAEPLPDPWALWRPGPVAYLEAVREALADASTTDSDRLREQGMAYAVRRLVEQGSTVLAIVGLAHARGLAEQLGRSVAAPLARTRRSAVTLRHVHPDSLSGLLLDPPLAHAAWEAVRTGAALQSVPLETALARPVDLVRDGWRLISGESPETAQRRRGRVVAYAAPELVRPVDGIGRIVDRARLAPTLWRIAAGSYERTTRQTVEPWQRRMYFDFSRRYARVQGMLLPGLYELVTAARGVADDNLAWEVFDAARAYPWQHADAEIPTARVDGELLDLGTHTVRFRRRFFRTKQRPVPVKRGHRDEDPSRWLEGFVDADSICSHPPEDLVVEDYGRYLQHKAVSVLSAERSRSQPFSTGLADGIDLRETIRHWLDGEVWVRELGRAPGEAGSVVVVFDEDPTGGAYPYMMTWHGEHNQESDMAFYATDPTSQVVGPGILRARYGGFMMTFPPRRVLDVWSDPDYAHARSKPELLTLAAVDYSLERLIVHVGPTAPRSQVHDYAAAQRKRIVHIPLATLSPTALDRIRTLHILAGRDVRTTARDYIV